MVLALSWRSFYMFYTVYCFIFQCLYATFNPIMKKLANFNFANLQLHMLCLIYYCYNLQACLLLSWHLVIVACLIKNIIVINDRSFIVYLNEPIIINTKKISHRCHIIAIIAMSYVYNHPVYCPLFDVFMQLFS